MMMAMSEWAKRRRTIYAMSVFGVLFVIIAPIIFVNVYEPSSCFDGKLNQGETAVDRGGPCPILDERMLEPHAILWARSFPVRDGFYNAVAYIENPNQDAGVFDAAYQFKLYDERNILVAERFGRVSILPGQVFPIFESRIDTGNRVPARTFFSFSNQFVWERVEDPVAGIVISNEKLSGPDTSPRLEAEVRNSSGMTKDNVVIIATLFDEAGNAIAAARTLIEHLVPDARQAIVFTWPHPLTSTVSRIDIVPLAIPKRGNGGSLPRL
jgi:hypothetical protein